MSTPQDPKELARQRALALELRDTRLKHRLARELEAARKRERRAADLLGLAEALDHSCVSQVDYILQPKATDVEGQDAPSEPAPTRTKIQ